MGLGNEPVLAAPGGTTIDLNESSIHRSPISKAEILRDPITPQAVSDISDFGQLVGPNILATTGASTQPTNAKPVNNIQPTQEGVTIQHDAWTKTVPEAIANFLHISVLDFKIVPEYARILNYFPSSDSIKPKGVTIGEVLRTCLIPCVAIADVLAGKVRENGYGAVLTWFKRAEDFTKDDRTKSMDENIAELVRQMKLSNDIK